jgi:hypothetical protein
MNNFVHLTDNFVFIYIFSVIFFFDLIKDEDASIGLSKAERKNIEEEKY